MQAVRLHPLTEQNRAEVRAEVVVGQGCSDHKGHKQDADTVEGHACSVPIDMACDSGINGNSALLRLSDSLVCPAIYTCALRFNVLILNACRCLQIAGLALSAHARCYNLPVAIICLGRLLVLCLDVSHLSADHLPHAAGAALEAVDCAQYAGLNVVSIGDCGILDGLKQVLGLIHNLQENQN